jgi:tetratricopeptide (TPR) repeat protein
MVLCTYCDSTVPDDSPFCPVCGFRLKVGSSLELASVKKAETGHRRGSPGLLWYVVLSLLSSALLSATVGLAVLGMRDGLEERGRRNRDIGLEYYRRGLVHVEEGNYLLALAEFEKAVQLAPEYTEAREQLAFVQALVEDQAMPTSVALSEAVITLYGEARVLYADEQWEEVIIKLEQLRRLDASYHRQEVEEMLFDAYCRQATSLMEAGDLEEALARLESASEIRPDDQTITEQRLWLSLYLTGLTRWGVDWESAVETFQELYELNPYFLDVEQRLHDACLNLGDVYYEEGAWCVAEHQYGVALQIMITEAAIAKRDEARELCVEAVSVPTPSLVSSVVPTQAITSTATAAPSPAVQGYVGEFLGYADADATQMGIRVQVVSAEGQGVPGVELEISAYDWHDAKVTDAEGYCEFAGLTQELEFTVRLTQLPCTPFQVVTQWGKVAQVDFVER